MRWIIELNLNVLPSARRSFAHIFAASLIAVTRNKRPGAALGDSKRWPEEEEGEETTARDVAAAAAAAACFGDDR